MEFYVLISSIYFKTDKIKLIIYFINYPEKPYIKNFSSEDLIRIKIKFEKILKQIETQNFGMNEENCFVCEFAKGSKCILVRNES
jgi:hypothetical protein